MPKKTVENLEPMGSARTAINDNFTELYAALDGTSSSNGSSSSGGVGSLSAIRSVAGTFYADLPDAIVVKGSSSETRQHILTLQEIDDTRSDWQIIYRAEDHGDGGTADKRIQFKADEHGSYHDRIWFTDAMTTNNLKWFIDNDRAIYYGGGSSSSGGILSARISADGTIVSQTPDWIESCTHNNGTYDIIYKSDYFSSIPTIVATADLNNSGNQMNAQYDSPSLNGITINTFRNNGDGSIAADFSIIAHNVDATSNGSSSNDSSTSAYGGVGDSSEIQAVSNFAGKIPDGVIMKREDHGAVINYRFNYMTTDEIFFTHNNWDGTSSYHAKCNNDATGSGFITVGTYSTSYSTPNGETTLQQLIDNDNVVYYGSTFAGAVKTWCVFDGTGTDNTEMTIKAGANVASVLRVATGVYKVTMTNPMPSEHYSVSVDCNPWGNVGAYGGVADVHGTDVSRIPTATEFHIDVRDFSNNNLNVNRVTFHVVC